MNWDDNGYLISKNKYNENSIIAEVYTFNHGKCSGMVYGGTSRKQKRFFQIGNKLLLNFKSKSENKLGYFNIELLKAISPSFFDNKRKTVCLLAACTILKILLPERQINKKIYNSFNKMIDFFNFNDWINFYIFWELSLIKELGFETNLKTNYNDNTKKALMFNRNLLMENFIIPHGLKFPLFRNMLENYFL